MDPSLKNKQEKRNIINNNPQVNTSNQIYTIAYNMNSFQNNLINFPLGGAPGINQPLCKLNFFLPPKNTLKYKEKIKKTLVIDLDETLIHSYFDCEPNRKADISYDIVIENRKIRVNSLIRPYAKEFLEKMSKIYEIVIFTASLSEYASPLIDFIDKNNFCDFRLFREHCCSYNINKQNGFTKDLSKLSRNMESLIILDNNPNSYMLNQDNGLPITTWIEDLNDRELIKYEKYLEFLSKDYIKDVRVILREVKSQNNNICVNCILQNNGFLVDFAKFDKIIEIYEANNENNAVKSPYKDSKRVIKGKNEEKDNYSKKNKKSDSVPKEANIYNKSSQKITLLNIKQANTEETQRMKPGSTIETKLSKSNRKISNNNQCLTNHYTKSNSEGENFHDKKDGKKLKLKPNLIIENENSTKFNLISVKQKEDKFKKNIDIIETNKNINILSINHSTNKSNTETNIKVDRLSNNMDKNSKSNDNNFNLIHNDNINRNIFLNSNERYMNSLSNSQNNNEQNLLYNNFNKFKMNVVKPDVNSSIKAHYGHFPFQVNNTENINKNLMSCNISSSKNHINKNLKCLNNNKVNQNKIYPIYITNNKNINQYLLKKTSKVKNGSISPKKQLENKEFSINIQNKRNFSSNHRTIINTNQNNYNNKVLVNPFESDQIQNGLKNKNITNMNKRPVSCNINKTIIKGAIQSICIGTKGSGNSFKSTSKGKSKNINLL